jgi:tetratricopeptide (TPR) repeat protein
MATTASGEDETAAPLDFRDALARYEAGARESLLAGIDAELRVGGHDARLWHLQGLILRELERYSEALPALRRAAQLAPTSANIAHALARASYEAGLPSVDAYARALRLSPGDSKLLLGLAAALAAEGRIGDAIAGIEHGLKVGPQWTEGHETLAHLRWTEGERAGFARSFEEALAMMPGNIELRRQQIITLVHAEHWDDVLAAIAAGRAAVGDDPLFDANEAAVYSETGEPERAEALFAALADLPDATVQLRHARNLLRLARPQDASALIDPWLATPDAFLFWPYASIAWRILGDPRSEWLEGDPRMVEVYDIADRLPPLTSWRTRFERCTSPAASTSTSRCAAAPRPTAICSTVSIRSSRKCARASRPRWPSTLPSFPRPILATRCSDRRATVRSASPAPGRCGSAAAVITPITSIRWAGSARHFTSSFHRASAKGRRASSLWASRRRS